MITPEQYAEAIATKKAAEETINAYHIQMNEAFQQRLKDNPIFTDEELRYSATDLCPCGHGIAYPVQCGFTHYWDCSAILKGIADPSVEHCGKLPFVFYEIKSEQQPSAQGRTTRGMFRPRPAGPVEGGGGGR